MFRKFRFSNTHTAIWLRASFILLTIWAAPLVAKADPPILFNQANSNRAIALESVNLFREPFPLTSSTLLSTGRDQRTRITLFALNIAGATPSALSVDAEDESHRHYAFSVEYVGPVIGAEAAGISQVIVRLGDDIGNVGDVLVRLTYRNAASNRVRLGIGYVGGGLPDEGIRLSGRVTTNSGGGFPGAVVTLSGAQSAITVTNADGNYSFLNLSAVGSYTVTASRDNYTFSPPAQTFTNLFGNPTANFTATLSNFTISGQVADGNNPLSGVTVSLSGSQSATTTTDAGGNYSFTVPAGGYYQITPSAQYYTFSPPSLAVTNLSGKQVFNFKTSDLFSVLEFNGSPQTVDYGDFFELQPGQTQLGKFFWEFWAMPGTNAYARYMLSDGYGGAHALLFGFVGDSSGTRYSLYGNVWNGITAIDFGSDDGPAPGEWGHLAVGWDGNYIYTYFNGVPVGLKPFRGPRMPAGSNNGGGHLFIGGSDHNNFMGRIAQVRGFENSNPLDSGLQSVTFRPDTIFGLTPGTKPSPTSSFLTNFLRPAQTVPDLAGGRVGILRGTGLGATSPQTTYPLPQFVIDPDAPNTSTVTGPIAPAIRVDTPAPVPSAALIFDSFSRKNSTYAFAGHGGLDSTEGGRAGIKQWKTAIVTGGTPYGNEAFGILNGQAVALSDFSSGCLAWVETGSATGYLLARVSRHPGFYKTGIDTGITFRVANSANFFYAFTYGDDPLAANARKLIVGYWLNGRQTYLVVGVNMPESWTRLQVVTTSVGDVIVYADDTQVYSTTTSVLATATGAGLYNSSDNHALANRWDNFTIYDQP